MKLTFLYPDSYCTFQMALAEFDRFFKKFPAEVKEMIWVCSATSSPRIVTIKLDENQEIRVVHNIPALLHTNQHGTHAPELPLAIRDLHIANSVLKLALLP
jgi:hypothetical protein